MTILSVSGLSLSFGATPILENVTFGINEGERVGVIGVNGAGKTSLFRLLTGEYTPDRGSVTVLRGKTLGMLAQNTDLTPLGDVSVLDYMIAGFPHLRELEDEIERLEGAIGSGIISGILFEIQSYIDKKPDNVVIFTGGDAIYFVKKMKNSIFVVCNLVLIGLALITDEYVKEKDS